MNGLEKAYEIRNNSAEKDGLPDHGSPILTKQFFNC